MNTLRYKVLQQIHIRKETILGKLNIEETKEKTKKKYIYVSIEVNGEGCFHWHPFFYFCLTDPLFYCTYADQKWFKRIPF